MCAVVYLTVFVLGVFTFAFGLGANVLASLLPSLRRLRGWRLIVAGVVLRLGSGTIGVLQYRTSTQPQKPRSPSPSQQATVVPAVRQPSQWASDVEATCRSMVPTLNKELEALRAIDKDKIQANDKNETAAAMAVLRRLQDHYASYMQGVAGV
jgi:hypothetical protein